ncbi:DUF3383 family protein [Filifactor alocis]|uniref:DUF3383 family protein n=1 Tax=Filifactor alocis TaxID=143361 RepID=UPI003F9EE068
MAQAKLKSFYVNIRKLTKAVSQKGFGLILIVDTKKDSEYKLYDSVSSASEDYSVDTEVYKMASRIFGQKPCPMQVAVVGKQTEDANEITTKLNETVEKHNDFFFVTCTSNTDEVIKALSAWIDTQEKMYFVTSQNIDVAKSLSSENTVVMYHNDKDSYVAEGLAAVMATGKIGGETAKFKTVVGVTAADVTATQLKQIHDNHMFTCLESYGILQTTEGKTTSGEYIDVVMGAFWIQFKMEEGLAYLSVNSKKIPYTNQGIAQMVDVCGQVLKRATFEQDIIDIDTNGNAKYRVTFIPREDTDANDIANRTYSGIKWTAKLAGAIHKATIEGTLEY